MGWRTFLPSLLQSQVKQDEQYHNRQWGCTKRNPIRADVVKRSDYFHKSSHCSQKQVEILVTMSDYSIPILLAGSVLLWVDFVPR
jgi:hypothetical protein